MKALFVLLYIAGAIGTYGAAFATLDDQTYPQLCDYPSPGQWTRGDKGTAFMAAILPPGWIVIFAVSGFYDAGWRVHSKCLTEKSGTFDGASH